MHGLTKYLFISGFATLPHMATAQALACSGSDPDWRLTLDDTSTTFSFDRTSDMQIMQDDLSQNDDGVRAMTLVGPRDSAILIVRADTGSATVLTQRGQTPIILSGVCN